MSFSAKSASWYWINLLFFNVGARNILNAPNYTTFFSSQHESRSFGQTIRASSLRRPRPTPCGTSRDKDSWCDWRRAKGECSPPTADQTAEVIDHTAQRRRRPGDQWSIHGPARQHHCRPGNKHSASVTSDAASCRAPSYYLGRSRWRKYLPHCPLPKKATWYSMLPNDDCISRLLWKSLLGSNTSSRPSPSNPWGVRGRKASFECSTRESFAYFAELQADVRLKKAPHTRPSWFL